MNIKNIFAGIVSLLTKEDVHVLDEIIHVRMVQDLSLNKEQINHAYWDRSYKFWRIMPSPIRPSRGDIAIYRSFFTHQKERERVLILGSTPELRDMVAEMTDAKIYLADFSYKMPLEMITYMRHTDVSRERWVRDNWLELAFPENFFDIIIGDLVLQQFLPDLEPIFFQKMRSLLKKEGVFISRFQCLGDGMHKRTIASVVDDVLGQDLMEKQMFLLLKALLPLLHADPIARTLDRARTSRACKEFLMQTSIQKSFLRGLPDAISHPTVAYRDWSPPTEEGLKKILSFYFTIIDTKISDDYPYAPCYPLYLLKPRVSDDIAVATS